MRIKVPFGKKHRLVLLFALSGPATGSSASQTSHVIAWWKPRHHKKLMALCEWAAVIISTLWGCDFSCLTVLYESRTLSLSLLIWNWDADDTRRAKKAPPWPTQLERLDTRLLKASNNHPHGLEPTCCIVLWSCPCAGKSLEGKRLYSEESPLL